MKFVWLIIFITSSSASAACKSIQYEESKGIVSLDYSVGEGVTISNTLWLPKLIDEKEIIVDKGPVVIMASVDSYISYRVIDKNEIEFIGSKKSPYNFFKGSFTNPKDIAECSFIDGVKGVEKRSYFAINDLEFFVHETNTNITIYILSESIDIVVEVVAKNLPREIINDIVTKAYIK